MNIPNRSFINHEVSPIVFLVIIIYYIGNFERAKIAKKDISLLSSDQKNNIFLMLKYKLGFIGKFETQNDIQKPSPTKRL